jgi:hypothetical protein
MNTNSYECLALDLVTCAEPKREMLQRRLCFARDGREVAAVSAATAVLGCDDAGGERESLREVEPEAVGQGFLLH